MKLRDFEKLSLNRALSIKKNLAAVRPALQKLSTEYQGFIGSGEVSKFLAANKEDYWFEKVPETGEVNSAIAYLAFNDVIELEGEDWNLSEMHHNNFDIDSYDDDRCRKSIVYLDWQSWQHIKNGATYSDKGNEQLDFNNFQEFNDKIA